MERPASVDLIQATAPWRQTAVRSKSKAFQGIFAHLAVTRMTINRNALAAPIAALISLFFSGTLYGGTIATIDLSANVIESILPGGTVFHDSKPLFGTTIRGIEPVARSRSPGRNSPTSRAFRWSGTRRQVPEFAR